MDFLGSLLEGAAHEVFGDDADDVIDTVGGIFGGGDGDDGDDGGGSGGWGSALGRFLGGSGGGDDGDDGGGSGSWGSTLGRFLDGFDGDSDGSEGGGSDGDGGGWASTIGGWVDRLSGDGGRDSLVDGLVDKVSSYLPADVRSAAGSIFGADASSWAGSLVDATSTAMPAGWQSVANAAMGHGFGEAGPGAMLHSLFDASPGTDGQAVGTEPNGFAPDVQGQVDQLGHLGGASGPMPQPDLDPAPDPRVTMPHDALGADRYDDDPSGQDGAGAGYDDYDDMVTSGTSSPDYEPPDAGPAPVPDDPTFPTDADPAPAPTPEPAPAPMDDFQQDISEADQVDQSMDAMFDGLG